jgi:heat shock gene repressor HrcA
MSRSAVLSPINELNERSREIFRLIVDGYVATGEPIGSRTVSRLLAQNLSPATIRNVMADLEEAGLLYAPHTSAGRMPTDAGLRLFVDGLLEVGSLAEDERRNIESICAARGMSLPQALEEAISALSGLSHCAGVVVAPKQDRPLKHIEFVHLGPGRALVVLVTEDGLVENRVIEVPLGLPPSSLVAAGNYMTARGFRQTSRLINCKPRCRYALSLNNRQNNSCQNKQQLLRSRCLIPSEVTSSRLSPTGSDRGAKNIGCSDEDRPLIVS